MSFYAGYDVLNTDVAVFETEKARNDWVSDEGLIHRVALTENEAMQIAEDSHELHKDEFEEGIMWIYNRINM